MGGTIIDEKLNKNVENAQEIATDLPATNRYGVLWILDDLQPHPQSIFVFPKHTSSDTECSIIVTSHHTIDKIFNGKSKPLLVSLLRCLHEAQDPALCLYVAVRLWYKLDLSETSLSPLDCLSVGFFLSSISDTAISVHQLLVILVQDSCQNIYLQIIIWTMSVK